MSQTSNIKDLKKLIIKTDKKLNKFNEILNKNAEREEIYKLEKLDKSRVKFESNLNKIEDVLKKVSDDLSDKNLIKTKKIIKSECDKLHDNLREFKIVIINLDDLKEMNRVEHFRTIEHLKMPDLDDIKKSFEKPIKGIENKMKEEFEKITNFFNSFAKKLIEIFKMISDKFESVIKEIVKIGKTVEKMGETFFNKYMKPIFFEIFGAMKEVFEFIWKDVIPFLKNVILFIIKEVPIILQNLKIFAINYYNTMFISTILTIFIFVGTQIYLKRLLETESTIPHLILFIITAYIMWNIIMNNTDNLKDVQEKFFSFVILLLKSYPFRKLLGLSDNFGENTKESIDEIAKVLNRKPLLTIIFVIVTLNLVKSIGKYTYNKSNELVYNSFEKLKNLL
jgi:predicted  nucleic acid-binding Zn-ribbon protein